MKTIAVRVLALFVVSLPLFGGSFERFPLPRTLPEALRDIEAGPNVAWALTNSSGLIVKIDAAGAIVDTYRVAASAIAFDPTDGGVWFASFGQVGHIGPTGAVTTWTAAAGNNIADIVIGSDDALWLIGSYSVIRFTPNEGTTASFPLPPGFYPLAMVSGSDGNLWMIDHQQHLAGRLTLAGTFTLYDLGAANLPMGITSGPDGKLWIATIDGELITITTAGTIATAFSSTGRFVSIAFGTDGRLYRGGEAGIVESFDTSTNSVITTFPAGSTPVWALSASPQGVWWGSEEATIGRIHADGTATSWPFTPVSAGARAIASTAEHLWFVAENSDQVGRMALDGTTVLYDLPNPGSGPDDIAVGSDGNVWFTELDGNRIGRINPATGAIQEFSVPSAGAQPSNIVAGPDGNLWFTMPPIKRIGRITTAGLITEFDVPGDGVLSSIAAGPDGNVWFTRTERFTGKVGRITPVGVVTEFAAQTSSPTNVTLGPDGNLWYDTSSNGLYRMNVDGNTANLGAGVGLGRITGPDGLQWGGGGLLRRLFNDFRIESILPPEGESIGGNLTIGPDGQVWYGSEGALYRITLDAPLSAAGMQICLPESLHVSGVIATFSDPDTTRDASFYEARVDWGDGLMGQVELVTVTQTAPGQFNVSGTHDYSSLTPRTLQLTILALRGPNRIGGTAWATGEIQAPMPEKYNYAFSGGGGTGSIPLVGIGSCPWKATSNRDWIIVPVNGSGPSLPFEVAPNGTGVARSGAIAIGTASITIQQSAESRTSLYLVTPCRVFDSRNSGVPLAVGSSEQFTAGGRCGIPANAQAMVANITVVAPSDNGWLAAYKAGQGWGGVSTVSYRKGKTRANNAIVGLSGGAFNMFNGGGVPVHVIVDVTGYFQ